MSVSTSTYLVYGGVFDLSDFFREIRERGCDHPESDSKFCPECGKPMWTSYRNWVFDDVNDVGDVGYISPTWYDERNPTGEVAIGLVLAIVRDYNEQTMAVPEITDEMKQKLSSFCAEHNIKMQNPSLVLAMHQG